MYAIRLLNRKETASLLEMQEVVGCVEEAYGLYSTGKAGLWPVIFHEFQPGVRDMDIKSGYLEGAGLFGLKVVGYSAENPQKIHAPALAGLVLVFSIETGQPLGLVDGMTVTNLRTGAAGGVGAKFLARRDSRHVFICGTGAQGRAQLQGLAAVMPGLEKVTVTGPREEESEQYKREMSRAFPRLTLETIPWKEREAGVSRADIIVTCTPAREPLIMKDWVRPGTHINAIGADMTEKQEIDPLLVASARLFVDSASQALHHGECHHAYDAGLILKEEVAEIGSLIAGSAQGRQGDEEITLFDATGMALQDIITSHLALKRGEERGLGTLIEM
jgi:ornithine cyclodeaminase/alanine dehydrogenase